MKPTPLKKMSVRDGRHGGCQGLVKGTQKQPNQKEASPDQARKGKVSMLYSKTCVKRPLSKWLKIGFQDQLTLNGGQKSSLGYHLSLRSLFVYFWVAVLHKLIFKPNYCLMQVENIAECSKGSILQYFRSSLSYHLSLRSLFCLFLSGCFTQILLYMNFRISTSEGIFQGKSWGWIMLVPEFIVW